MQPAEPLKEQLPPHRPKMKLVGQDGNIFSILGRASRLLKENGQPDQAKEMCDRVYQSGDYYKALNIISEYVETELSEKTHTKSKNEKERGDARWIRNTRLPTLFTRSTHGCTVFGPCGMFVRMSMREILAVSSSLRKISVRKGSAGLRTMLSPPRNPIYPVTPSCGITPALVVVQSFPEKAESVEKPS